MRREPLGHPSRRTGTVEPFTRADGTVYHRGKIRLRDGSRHRIDVDEPFCFDVDRARTFVAEVQRQEDTHGRILAAKLGLPPPRPPRPSASGTCVGSPRVSLRGTHRPATTRADTRRTPTS
jgi:hypothetical protein